MNTKFASVLFLLGILPACSSPSAIDALQRTHSESTQLLEQQSIRMEMQEEYLAQLAESQQELVSSMERVARQVRRMQVAQTRQQESGATDEASAGASVDEPMAETVQVLPAAEKKLVVGRNEWVWLELLGRNLKARVDTGALSSSLSAVDLLPFERDGREWIRFRVPDEEHPDGGDLYEAPLVKYVRIRQTSAEELERRPVIRLTVRLGELVDDVEFNLTNREDMLYPVLLGRNFLRDVALVDVAKKFTQPKYIPENSSKQVP